MSGVVRTLSRCLLPAEAGGARERRAGGGGARDAEREARRRSRDIDAGLARERRAVRRLVKILLLGAGESGKSTFLKQMRIIHGREFDQKALLEFRDTIFDNILKVRAPRPHTCAQVRAGAFPGPRRPGGDPGPLLGRRPGVRAASPRRPRAFASALLGWGVRGLLEGGSRLLVGRRRAEGFRSGRAFPGLGVPSLPRLPSSVQKSAVDGAGNRPQVSPFRLFTRKISNVYSVEKNSRNSGSPGPSSEPEQCLWSRRHRPVPLPVPPTPASFKQIPDIV